ncbi:hypothetical protein [Streptomyces europaeiscabiei]|uniref:hypothetical protein n=1 Tax=Streptomyces europaeiscabiei TaxID=146819 RepID=UPI0038F5D988
MPMEAKDWWQVAIGGAGVLVALSLGAYGTFKANDVGGEQKKFTTAQQGLDASVEGLLKDVRDQKEKENAVLISWSSSNTALGRPRVITIRNYSKVRAERVLISIHNAKEKSTPVAQHLFAGELDACRQKTFEFTADGVKYIQNVAQVSFTFEVDGLHWRKLSGKSSVEKIPEAPVRAGQSIWEPGGDGLVWVDDGESDLSNC